LAATVRVATDLSAAVHAADIISCATLAQDALIKGEWLREGQHLDLVGAFTPEMQEADEAAVARADVYVDTYGGAMSEAGDIIRAIRAGVFTEDAIKADLAQLVKGDRHGRTSDDSITLFKSVGAAIEDLAAAQLVMRMSDADEY